MDNDRGDFLDFRYWADPQFLHNTQVITTKDHIFITSITKEPKAFNENITDHDRELLSGMKVRL
jgi:hypothetical protein